MWIKKDKNVTRVTKLRDTNWWTTFFWGCQVLGGWNLSEFI